MKQVYIIAALALLTAPVAQALPTFKAPPKEYKNTSERATYYDKNVFDKKTAKDLAAMNPASYVVLTNTPLAPLIGFLGSDDNLRQWQADTMHNPTGGFCAHNNVMNYYDGNGNVMYSIKGPFDNVNAPLKSFTVTAVGNSPTGASIAPSPKNTKQVGLTRLPGPKSDEKTHCLYPTIYLPVTKGNFNISSPVPIIKQGKKLSPSIEQQFTDMVLFGYNALVLSSSGNPPVHPPTAKELQKTPGIGGILYYNASGDFVCAFYTNGWSDHKEGWTAEAPKGLETLDAYHAN